MNISASVQTGRARPKVSTTSCVTLGPNLPLTCQKLKDQSYKFLCLKNCAFFEDFQSYLESIFFLALVFFKMK